MKKEIVKVGWTDGKWHKDFYFGNDHVLEFPDIEKRTKDIIGWWNKEPVKVEVIIRET